MNWIIAICSAKKRADETFDIGYAPLAIGRIAAIACFFVCFAYSNGVPAYGAASASSNVMFENKKCLDAAQKVLGKNAEVLKCGTLNDPSVLESIAAVRMRKTDHDATGIFVSRLVILRETQSRWTTALNVSRHIENEVGYVGVSRIENLDESSPFWAHYVEFYDHRPDGRKAFVLGIGYMASRNDTDELAVVIAWDKATGRYREFSVNTDRVGFQPECQKPARMKP